MKKLLSKTEAAFSHVIFVHFFGNWKILKALSYKKKTDEEYCTATTSLLHIRHSIQRNTIYSLRRNNTFFVYTS